MKLCSGLRNGVVRMWDMVSGVRVHDFCIGAATAKKANTSVASVAIDCEGQRCLSGLEDGHLVFWHYSLRDPVKPTQGGSVATSADTSVAKATPLTKVVLAHYCAIRTIVA